MRRKFNKQKTRRQFQMPQLALKYRLLLYGSMFVFVILSMINVFYACFNDLAAIGCYGLTALTFAAGIVCLVSDVGRHIKKTVKSVAAVNPYVSRMACDDRLRTVVLSVPEVVENVLFAVLNGVTGIVSHSAWLGTLSAYYILLSIMRISAISQAWKISQMTQDPVRKQKEFRVYSQDSVLFLLLALVLAGMVILLEFSAGGKTYPGLTIYAAAAYAFYRITLSMINMIKVKKLRSPLLMIIRKIGYADACVSILILQTALFSSFAQPAEAEFVKLMNGMTGSGVCVMIFAMGVQGLCAGRQMKERNG